MGCMCGSRGSIKKSYPISFQDFCRPHVMTGARLMNFQRLFGPIRKSREDRFFDHMIGHEHAKRSFGLALRSDEPTHTLLSRPTGISEDKVTYFVATTCEGFVFCVWRKHYKDRNNRLYVQEPQALSSRR
jgi:hypothetical protein